MGYLLLFILNLLVPFAALAVVIFFALSPRRRVLNNIGKELAERFVLKKGLKNVKDVIWFHAASVGEVRSIAKIAGELKIYYKKKILITTSTSAGRAAAMQEMVFDAAVLMPIDSYPLVKKFIRAYKPYRLFIVEADLWPNMIVASGRSGVPVLIINGRVSLRSSKRYKLLGSLLKLVLKYINIVCAQTDEIKARYEDMGIPANKVFTTGNIKYDMLNSQPAKEEEAEKIIELLGWKGANIVACGSTHEEEEEIIINAAKKLQDVKFIIAPRHLERKEDILTKLNNSGLKFTMLSSFKKSEEIKKTEGVNILLADAMGWLGAFYKAAGITFVGGSISKKGGHNFLEAAVLARPVLFGQYYYNAPEVAKKLLENGGGFLVNKDNFDTIIKTLFSSSDELAHSARLAGETASFFKGATEATIKVVKKYEEKH
ncbi:MAG: hypothetical protein LBM71_03730 [Elusimicrobiota bacterium]|jgi:3-deoxy-D-manno-octulosonic-acid transferase|nr:hypothetical protein [Elusimicrobiota bacterium]